MNNKIISAKDLAKVAVFVCLIAICSWISIPFTVPFTMQTFAVCFMVYSLSIGYSLLSLTAYLLLGFFGVPVFSGFNSGAGYLLGTTGGYIIGFYGLVLVSGLLNKLFGKNFILAYLSMVAGLVCCYLFGTVWFVKIYGGNKGFLGALSLCVFPFVIPDLIKIFLALLLSKKIKFLRLN